MICKRCGNAMFPCQESLVPAMICRCGHIVPITGARPVRRPRRRDLLALDRVARRERMKRLA